jgi:hypothetical protein
MLLERPVMRLRRRFDPNAVATAPSGAPAVG